MSTVADTETSVSTIQQCCLITQTLHVIKPDDPFSTAKDCSGKGKCISCVVIVTDKIFNTDHKKNKSRLINTKALVGFHLSFTIGKSKLSADDCRVFAVPLVITNCPPVVVDTYLHPTLVCCCAIHQPHGAICTLLHDRIGADYADIFTVSTIVVPNSIVSAVFEKCFISKTTQAVKEDDPSPLFICCISNVYCSYKNSLSIKLL